ncbi:unnamed protein product, partial [Iphiclides podalirius]
MMQNFRLPVIALITLLLLAVQCDSRNLYRRQSNGKQTCMNISLCNFYYPYPYYYYPYTYYYPYPYFYYPYVYG